MAVQAGAVLDLEPAHRYVPDQLRAPAQYQLVARVEGAFHVALDRDVRCLKQGLDLGPGGNIDIARHAKFAFGSPVDVHGAVVSQLAFKAVVRSHREPTGPITLFVLGSLHRRAFCDCLLYVHELESPPHGLRLRSHRSRAHRLLQRGSRLPREAPFVARQRTVAPR